MEKNERTRMSMNETMRRHFFRDYVLRILCLIRGGYLIMSLCVTYDDVLLRSLHFYSNTHD